MQSNSGSSSTTATAYTSSHATVMDGTTFTWLILRSMHAERLLLTIRIVSSTVLIAQAVFLL